MFLSVILIIMAWVVEMPQWLSILTTVFCGIHIVLKLVEIGMDMK